MSPKEFSIYNGRTIMKLLSSSSRYCTRVDCAVFLQPYFEPSAQKRDSPVSHSYITRQLNNIAASLLTQEEYFTLLTPSDSSVSQKSCLACSADAQGHEAALPEVPAWADAAVQEQWQQPVPATSCQHVPSQSCQELSFPPCPPLLVHCASVGGQPGSGLLPKPHSLDNEIQHTAKRLCDKCGRFKPVSRPSSSYVQTQTAEMLPPAPLQFLSKCAKMQL